MLGQYIYDTRSMSEMQYQGPPKTKEERRQEMRNHLDRFDRQFGLQAGQATYEQSYTGTRR